MGDFTLPASLHVPRKLDRSVNVYVLARTTHDQRERRSALGAFFADLQGLYGRRLIGDICAILTAMDDLSDDELSELTVWIPADADLYLHVSSHAGATSNTHLCLLFHTTQGNARSRPDVGRRLREKFQRDHPLVLSVFDAHPSAPDGLFFPYRHLIDDLEDIVRDDPTLLAVVTALLPTWTGTSDTLLATARGILT